MHVDLSQLVKGDAAKGDDAEDTRLLQLMHTDAKNFLKNFHWCDEVRTSYFGCGIGGIVAVFLLQIVSSSPDVDEWLWVVVGDIPPAYLVMDDSPTPQKALEMYVELMREWAKAVELGRDVSQLIPVNRPARMEVAEELKTRLDMIEHFGLCESEQKG